MPLPPTYPLAIWMHILFFHTIHTLTHTYTNICFRSHIRFQERSTREWLLIVHHRTYLLFVRASTIFPPINPSCPLWPMLTLTPQHPPPPADRLWNITDGPHNDHNPQTPTSTPTPPFQSNALRPSDEPYNNEVPVMRYEQPDPQRGMEAVRQREARVEGRDGEGKSGGWCCCSKGR